MADNAVVYPVKYVGFTDTKLNAIFALIPGDIEYWFNDAEVGVEWKQRGEYLFIKSRRKSLKRRIHLEIKVIKPKDCGNIIDSFGDAGARCLQRFSRISRK